MRALAPLFFLCACLLATAGSESAPSTPPDGDTDRVSVDFPNEEIRTILRNVADLYELNLVVPENLHGRTSVTMRDATWRQILRKALYPVGYDFEEDESIIRVFSLGRNHVREFPFTGKSRASEASDLVALALGSLPLLPLLPLLLVHLILCGALIRDPLAIKPRFAPKAVWALLVLGGGFVPLLAYWLMHHSRLAPPTRKGATV